MPTLAQELRELIHCSPLLRAAHRAGLESLTDFTRLAVARGCSHYSPAFPPLDRDPGPDLISNEELVALLLLGSHEYNAIAVRCAAQLSGSCRAEILALVAKRERVSRALAYIARAGVQFDETKSGFWRELLELLGEQPPIAEGIMPHWSRFVLQTGITKDGGGKIQWLHCQ
jgi:hypothetical protein